MQLVTLLWSIIPIKEKTLQISHFICRSIPPCIYEDLMTFTILAKLTKLNSANINFSCIACMLALVNFLP